MDNCLPLYYWHAALHMMLFYVCIYMVFVLFHSQAPFPTFPYCMLKNLGMQHGKSVGYNRPEVGLEMDLHGFINIEFIVTFFLATEN